MLQFLKPSISHYVLAVILVNSGNERLGIRIHIQAGGDGYGGLPRRIQGSPGNFLYRPCFVTRLSFSYPPHRMFLDFLACLRFRFRGRFRGGFSSFFRLGILRLRRPVVVFPHIQGLSRVLVHPSKKYLGKKP